MVVAYDIISSSVNGKYKALKFKKLPMEFEVVLDKKVIMGFVIIHIEMVLH